MKKKTKLIIIISASAAAIVIILPMLILAACSALTASSEESTNETVIDTLEISTQLLEEEPAAEETTAGSYNSTTDTPNTEESIEETSREQDEEESQDTVSALSFRSNGNGTCSVSGIGNVTDSYISIPLKSPEGDVVVAIDEKAFFGNETLKAIELPSTVSDIGLMAFSNCPSLIYISVNSENRNFVDVGGVLYNADMTKLIAYPASGGASAITIPSSVTAISPMAFYGCNTLKMINFEGTLDQWSKVEKGDLNYGLYHISILCSDTAK